MAWESIKNNPEGARYNSKLKIQGDAIIEHAFFDSSNNFSFEKYFQVHVKLHEIHAAALDPVPEWRKWNAFVKVIMSIQLQDEYRGIKDDAR